MSKEQIEAKLKAAAYEYAAAYGHQEAIKVVKGVAELLNAELWRR